MDEVLDHHDIKQLYVGALFYYKKDVVRIRAYEYGDVSQFNLRTRKTSTMPFVIKDYTPVLERIGMVNIGKMVVYIVRNTNRQYQISVSPSNVTMNYPPTAQPEGYAASLKSISSLEAPELLAALANDYPPLEVAFKKAVEWGTACAFDKQFVVSATNNIIYKCSTVGKYVNGVIKFSPEYAHLHSVLENCYEKTSRTYKATPIRR